MMRSTRTQDITSVTWSDVEIHGVMWQGAGRDLVLRVQFPGIEPPDDRSCLIAFRWAEGILINLQFPEKHGGYLLTWDATFTRNPDGGWSVVFDFAHAGSIRLKCTD